MAKATRIKIGQTVVIEGVSYIVESSQRGRKGEARTMYVIRRERDTHKEVRSRETLLRYLAK